jgi:hypothetical protein
LSAVTCRFTDVDLATQGAGAERLDPKISGLMEVAASRLFRYT